MSEEDSVLALARLQYKIEQWLAKQQPDKEIEVHEDKIEIVQRLLTINGEKQVVRYQFVYDGEPLATRDNEEDALDEVDKFREDPSAYLLCLKVNNGKIDPTFDFNRLVAGDCSPDYAYRLQKVMVLIGQWVEILENVEKEVTGGTNSSYLLTAVIDEARSVLRGSQW